MNAPAAVHKMYTADMEPAVLAASALGTAAAADLLLGYYGAGMLMHPPAMSPMEIFPDRFGASYEKISFPTPDGLTLSGWFIPSADGGDRTVLVCHGWGDNKGLMLEQTLFLRREGCNLFYFDFRGHGESGGNRVTLGKEELLDFSAAVDCLRRTRPKCAANLAVLGQSMGAAVAAMGLAAHPEIKAAVLESPFADFHQVGRRWGWSRLRVPYFPVIMTVMYMARLRTGHADIDSYSPESFLPAARTPVLMIAGEKDMLMPPADVLRLFGAAHEPKEYWQVPGAAHAKCHEAAPAAYEARVGAFLRAHLD